jgi:hypothetical protein
LGCVVNDDTTWSIEVPTTLWGKFWAWVSWKGRGHQKFPGMRASILIIILFGIVSGYLILGISGIFHIRLIDSVRFQLPLQDTIGRRWISYSVSFISHVLVPHPPACTPGAFEFNMVNEVSQFLDPLFRQWNRYVLVSHLRHYTWCGLCWFLRWVVIGLAKIGRSNLPAQMETAPHCHLKSPSPSSFFSQPIRIAKTRHPPKPQDRTESDTLLSDPRSRTIRATHNLWYK